MSQVSFHLFERFGVELEYMIVEATTLDVAPIADQVLRRVAGEYVSDVDVGSLSWSNELALHVIELKTGEPAASFQGLAGQFQAHVRQINEILAPLGARLMPTAMHPWMDPLREMRLWPHDCSPIYQAFNRVFDCRGHGWANLQSVHLNLPFSGDAEFARLHAAIRLLLPILPALAASSPVMDGAATGRMDNRLEVYRHNARRIPSISGQVIPEPVFSRQAYEREILQRLYRDIAPHDPEGTLQYEWLNARGAIARFDRDTIEIRVLDVQECPSADLAVCWFLTAVLQAMCEERWLPLDRQQAFSTERLHAILLDTIRDAERAEIRDPEYLAAFGFSGRGSAGAAAGQLWRHLRSQLAPGFLPEAEATALDAILGQGPLARRIVNSMPDGQPTALRATYDRLCRCLAQGEVFGAGG